MTTLPPFLFDSHKRYKEDTNRVITWLAETAQKCGHPLKVEAPASHPSGRLKGKARKQAREIERAEGSETTTSALRHTIAVNEFTGLAQWIANHKPSVKVPPLILRLFESAIALRKRCADWFQQKAITEEGMSDNFKHWHFIGVLERVLQILEPNSVSESVDSAYQGKFATPNMNTAAKSETELDKFSNIYDILYIDDKDFSTTPTTTTTTTENVASRQNISSEPRRVIYEAESTEEEMYFALFCFFDDLNRLRQFLRNLWQQYDAGILNLMTVSVTTNTAINLVRRAEQDFIATFPILESFDEIPKSLYFLLCEIRGDDPSTLEGPDDMLLVNDAMVNLMDWLYLSPHSVIKSFCGQIRDNDLLVVQRIGIANQCTDRPITSRERMKEDGTILYEALCEFLFWIKCTRDLPVLDELTDGLRTAFVDEIVPLWVAYAAQIFVDIHNVLQENVGRGLSQLQASGTQIVSSLKEYHSNIPVTFADWPSFTTADT